MQSHNNIILISSPKVHTRSHCSLAENDVRHRHVVLDYVGVENHTISRKSSGRRAVAIKDNVFIAYSHSKFLRTICHNVRGASQFHFELAYELLQCSVSNIVCRKRPIVEGKVINNKGVHFGYGCCQKRTTNTRYIGKEKCPTMTVEPFLNLTISTRRKLIIIFQAGTSFVKKYSPGAFPEEERNRLFPGVLNAAIKFPDSTALFGYYDIIIS